MTHFALEVGYNLVVAMVGLSPFAYLPAVLLTCFAIGGTSCSEHVRFITVPRKDSNVIWPGVPREFLNCPPNDVVGFGSIESLADRHLNGTQQGTGCQYHANHFYEANTHVPMYT